MKKLKLNSYLHLLYIKSRLKARLLSRLSAFRFRASRKTKLVTTGAYFSENFGDHMMGEILKVSFDSMGVAIAAVSYDQLSNIGSPECVICGGGELGDQDYFNQVFASVDQAEKVKVIGTSPYAKLHESSQELIEKLKKISFYSVRNKWAKEYLSGLLERDDVMYSPDLVFALPRVMPNLFANKTVVPRSGLVSISVLPYGMSILKSGEIVKDQAHLKMLAELNPAMADSTLEMAERYMQYSRNLIHELGSSGKSVQIVSFSYGDYLFAKACYSDLDVDILPFSKNPAVVLDAIRVSELFYTSRFHSMIFAMLADRPIMPFCYSMKCNNLLNDIFADISGEFIDRNWLLTKSIDDLHIQQLQLKPFYVDPDMLESLSSEAYSSILNLIQSIENS